MKVVVLMGSRSDLDHVTHITDQLDAWSIPWERHVASAHKSVRYLLRLIEAYNELSEPIVFVAVAGRSNALAGMLDANTTWPVITCPPVSSSFGGADIFSSLRMPTGVAPMVVLEPQGAALAAAKILAMHDVALRARLVAYQEQLTQEVIRADQSVQ
ncbi:MAG: AIR carboxylase family protein [Anaerolineales bacterium]